METFLIVAVAIPIMTAIAVYQRRDASSAWQEAATRCGLSLRGSGHKCVLSGNIGNAEVTVDFIERMQERKSIGWTRIRASTDIPPGLIVGGEGFWRKWNESQGEDSVDMAGVAFDEHVIVRGAVPQIFALLNGDTRSQFRELEKQCRAFVIEGQVNVEKQGIVRDAEELARLMRRVATLAMALSLNGPAISDRLGANVVTDSNALVRLRNLELLLDRYPESESARLACQHALSDRSHAVSVLAARQCGEEALPTLERILADEKAPFTLKLQALEHMVGLMDLESATELLLLIVNEDPALKVTALVTLASIGHDPGADLIASLLENADAEGWIAYAQSITALERQDMTEPLELLLDSEEAHEVVTLILQALEPEDERFVQAEPLTFPIPEEVRLNLEVQEASQAAMRELANWSFNELELEQTSELAQGLDEEREDKVEEGPRELRFEKLSIPEAEGGLAEADGDTSEVPESALESSLEVKLQTKAD